MARTAASQASRTPAPRPAALVAIERMAKLAQQGVAPHKMVAAVDDLLVQWAAEDLEPDVLRERIETLQTDLDAGAQAAEDYVVEAESAAQKTAATKQLDGLRAARDRLAELIAG